MISQIRRAQVITLLKDMLKQLEKEAEEDEEIIVVIIIIIVIG